MPGTRPVVGVRSGRSRAGVTLLELVVVMVVVGMSATLAVPAMRRMLSGDDASRPAEEQLVIDGRRQAVTRGEPLLLAVAGNGAWSLTSVRTGLDVASGHTTRPLAWLPRVTIDAMGNCVLVTGTAPPPNAARWDALRCEWRMEAGAQP